MDALDTLYIMEMFEEFDAATDWVEKNLDFNVVREEDDLHFKEALTVRHEA